MPSVDPMPAGDAAVPVPVEAGDGKAVEESRHEELVAGGGQPRAACSVADGSEHTFPPAALMLARVQWWILTAILGAISFGGVLLGALISRRFWVAVAALSMWALFVAWLGILSHFGTALAHRHATYRVDERAIHVRRGMLWRTVVSVPRSRVQHTDVSQGPLGRRLGLGTLQIYTAGTEHAQVSVEGLPHATAIGIRDYLIAAADGHGV